MTDPNLQLCYIHSKLMIVDDRRVICGSANLNDRSQNGDHDSEIAILMGKSWFAQQATGNRLQFLEDVDLMGHEL